MLEANKHEAESCGDDDAVQALAGEVCVCRAEEAVQVLLVPEPVCAIVECVAVGRFFDYFHRKLVSN